MTDSVFFPCTPGGEILRSRRRLGLLLAALGILVLAAAIGAWFADSPGSTLVAVIVALIPWTAWRMSGDLDPVYLEIDRFVLHLQLRRQSREIPIAGATARRLTQDERRYLQGLATRAGFTSGCGGFDSHLLGEIELAASNFSNAVLVEAGETRIVLSPDDPQGFLDAVGDSPR